MNSLLLKALKEIPPKGCVSCCVKCRGTYRKKLEDNGYGKLFSDPKILHNLDIKNLVQYPHWRLFLLWVYREFNDQPQILEHWIDLISPGLPHQITFALYVLEELTGWNLSYSDIDRKWISACIELADFESNTILIIALINKLGRNISEFPDFANKVHLLSLNSVDIQIVRAKALYGLTLEEKRRQEDTLRREKRIWQTAFKRIKRAEWLAKWLVARKQESKERKMYREKFLQLSLINQIEEMARNKDYSIKVYPINPDNISNNYISQLTKQERKSLHKKVEIRWEKPWKRLAGRICYVSNT